MIYKIKDPVYFCGDLHGNFRWIGPYLKRYDITDCSIVFCGDVGLGFSSYDTWKNSIRDIRLAGELKKRKICLYFIRGNHDNPAWYDDRLVNTPYMKAVSDYSVLQSPSHNILCIGGGVSVDRKLRLQYHQCAVREYLKYHPRATLKDAEESIRRCYWTDELPVFDKDRIASLDCKIDTVCSHAAPKMFPPESKPVFSYWQVDETLKQDCFTERNVLTQVYDELVAHSHPIRNWFYGHYHCYETSVQENGIIGHLLDMARNGNLCMKDLTNE